LADSNTIEVRNANWQRGIGSSIRSGVQALIDHAQDVDAILLLVCDQPAVNAQFVESLIAARNATKKDIAASTYANTVGVPALFVRSLFKELLSLGDEAGAKSIILQKTQCVVQLPFPDGAIDVDTREDWEKAQRTQSSSR
jgi:molybdenum cofactor cytidylyltransferase